MRRFTALLLLLALLCPLAAQADRPGDPPVAFPGRWETSPEETLCATVLFMLENGEYMRISAGVTTRGTWTQEEYALTLLNEDAALLTWVYDPEARAIVTGDGLHLHRAVRSMDGSGWQSFTCIPEAYTGFFTLLMFNDNSFELTYYSLGDVNPDLPEVFHDATPLHEGVQGRMAFGHYLDDGTTLTLAAYLSDDVWQLPLDPETGLPTDTDDYHFIHTPG